MLYNTLIESHLPSIPCLLQDLALPPSVQKNLLVLLPPVTSAPDSCSLLQSPAPAFVIVNSSMIKFSSAGVVWWNSKIVSFSSSIVLIESLTHWLAFWVNFCYSPWMAASSLTICASCAFCSSFFSSQRALLRLISTVSMSSGKAALFCLGIFTGTFNCFILCNFVKDLCSLSSCQCWISGCQFVIMIELQTVCLPWQIFELQIK